MFTNMTEEWYSVPLTITKRPSGSDTICAGENLMRLLIKKSVPLDLLLKAELNICPAHDLRSLL